MGLLEDGGRVDRRVAMLASHIVPGGASPDSQVSLHRTAAAPAKQGFKVAVLGAAGGRAQTVKVTVLEDLRVPSCLSCPESPEAPLAASAAAAVFPSPSPSS